eukprot:3881328-Amphidinium_carterae.1
MCLVKEAVPVPEEAEARSPPHRGGGLQQEGTRGWTWSKGSEQRAQHRFRGFLLDVEASSLNQGHLHAGGTQGLYTSHNMRSGAYKGGQLPVMPRTVGLPTYAVSILAIQEQFD